MRQRYEQSLSQLVAVAVGRRGRLSRAWRLLIIAWQAPRIGREIFPVVDAGQFRLRIRAPNGTHIARTERYALDMLDLVKQEVGADNVALTLGYVGMIPANFPINAVYQWSRGPEEAILYVDLDEKSGVRVEELKERLRQRVAEKIPELRVSFEPSDIVNEVMSFGSPTPIEIAVSGPSLPDSRAFAEKLRAELAQISVAARHPIRPVAGLSRRSTCNIDREKTGLAGLTPVDVSRALTLATSSSRFIVPNYWADPKTGIAYQVQVEVPQPVLRSPDDRVRDAQIGRRPGAAAGAQLRRQGRCSSAMSPAFSPARCPANTIATT